MRDRTGPLGPAAEPARLGVHPVGDGVDVALFAEHATAVELCLPAEADREVSAERRITLPHRVNGIWHAHVPGPVPGDRYGFRVHGPWHPEQGHRYDPTKLLLDPYARAVVPPRPHDSLFSHPAEAEERTVVRTVTAQSDGLSETVTETVTRVVSPTHRAASATAPDPVDDSASHAAWGVVVGERVAEPSLDAALAARPRTPWARTVVYEAHVRGFTMRHPGVPEHLRGTYAGLAHPAAVSHLVDLGVTAVQLLPVHAFLDETRLTRLGLRNYWGYNTLAFFAPEPRYSASVRAGGPAESAVGEFREMVAELHRNGLEVLLDVVYNHTCEGGADGPTLSWRGIDNAAYYRTDGPAFVDMSGCGNTLDLSHPEVVRMVLDSLRYWVEQMGVDGFRFDLMTALARDHSGEWDPLHPLLVALRTDPVLRSAKLVAEPWDVGPGGWRTGQFPAPLAEWNDRFRDSVREFWLSGSPAASPAGPWPGVRDIATRLSGSEDLFGGRGPLASINYVTAHDGFTAWDLVSYDRKHNEANGEHGRDGHDHNLSDNHGVEGPSDDAEVLRARRATLRAVLGTLLLATGVPMLTAGDESGRTQRGNNNAYCHDSMLTWLDWGWLEGERHARDLFATVRFLLRLRARHPALRREDFFTGELVHHDGTRDLAWFSAEGTEMTPAQWHEHDRTALLMLVHAGHASDEDPPDGQAAADDGMLIVLHSGAAGTEVTLPGELWARGYTMEWSSAAETPDAVSPARYSPGSALSVPPRSLVLLSVDHH